MTASRAIAGPAFCRIPCRNSIRCPRPRQSSPHRRRNALRRLQPRAPAPHRILAVADPLVIDEAGEIIPDRRYEFRLHVEEGRGIVGRELCRHTDRMSSAIRLRRGPRDGTRRDRRGNRSSCASAMRGPARAAKITTTAPNPLAMPARCVERAASPSLPGTARGHLLFVACDLIILDHREADVVEPVQEAIFAERIDLKFYRHRRRARESPGFRDRPSKWHWNRARHRPSA